MPDDEQVYVLRLWHDPGRPEGQRISVYDPGSGERRYFRTLAGLLRWLARRQDPPPTPDSTHLQS